MRCTPSPCSEPALAGTLNPGYAVTVAQRMPISPDAASPGFLLHAVHTAAAALRHRNCFIVYSVVNAVHMPITAQVDAMAGHEPAWPS